MCVWHIPGVSCHFSCLSLSTVVVTCNCFLLVAKVTSTRPPQCNELFVKNLRLNVSDPKNADVLSINSDSQCAGKFGIPSFTLKSRRKIEQLTNKCALGPAQAFCSNFVYLIAWEWRCLWLLTLKHWRDDLLHTSSLLGGRWGWRRVIKECGKEE